MVPRTRPRFQAAAAEAGTPLLRLGTGLIGESVCFEEGQQRLSKRSAHHPRLHRSACRQRTGIATPCSWLFACHRRMCPSRPATPACLGPKAMFEGCVLPYAPVGLSSRKDCWDLSFAGATGLP